MNEAHLGGTRRLYYEDSHLQQAEATVLEVRQTDKGYETILDRTPFFPEGGGQPCDRGTIEDIPVLHVKEKGDTVVHLLPEPLAVGQQILCKIDWPYRFSLMQNHSGEHIVSGLVHAKYGYDNVGFHMGTEAVTLDLSGPMTPEQVREIEIAANRVVWANLPVRAYFPDPDTLRDLEYRSKLELTENVRIVEIGDIDRCACCAPHVSLTGEIGSIRLLDCQNYKGGVRISMLCGERALLQAEQTQDQIAELAVRFSVKQPQTAEAVHRLLEEHQNLTEERNRISMELLRYRAAEVPEGDSLLCLFEDLHGEDLRYFANFAAERNHGITAVFTPEGRYILISPGQDVQGLNQILRKQLGAKGGGRGNMAQGSLPASKEAILSFFKTLENTGNV
ncbi:MAG: hypothetical protein IJK56_07350 [Firmicutes bacterium]|nr:hypothetical protein [Bacillota bacterium]